MYTDTCQREAHARTKAYYGLQYLKPHLSPCHRPDFGEMILFAEMSPACDVLSRSQRRTPERTTAQVREQ